MANGKGGFIGQDGLNAPDPATGVSASGGDTQATVSFTAPTDVGGAAITGYSVQSNNGDGTWRYSYDLGNASYDSVDFSVASQDSTPVALTFKPDGTKMYVFGNSTSDIFQYGLSTAWDLSTASYESKSYSANAQVSNGPESVVFKSDGTKMFLLGNSGTYGQDVFRYSLSTAWDVSTASYDSNTVDVAAQDTGATSIQLNNDGTKLFLVGTQNDKVYQYSMSTAYDLSTATFTTGQDFSVATDPRGLFISSDGTKMFVLDTNDIVYKYTLSTAFDITTSSSAGSFSTNSEDTQMRDVAFKSDGTKMYTVGFTNDKVYQYTTGQLDYPTASPVTVTGLTNGTSYTFNVWAINAFGWSSPSDASESVSPAEIRGLIGGGTTGSFIDVIQYVSVSTTGNTQDFGDLHTPLHSAAACASSTRGVFSGGSCSTEHDGPGTGSGLTNRIQYVTIASTGNSTDFGNLSERMHQHSGAGSSTRGIFFGGSGNDSGSMNVIQYITIASAGDAADFGDLSSNRPGTGALASPTRAVSTGGQYGDVMEYVTINSTGNATDFGNLTVGSHFAASCSSNTRGIIGGGQGRENVLDYITIASTGNATDFGDLTANRMDLASFSSSTRGVWAGGGPISGGQSNVIDYVTISSTGNATDFGDLLAATDQVAGCSNGHGGLS